MPDADRAQHPRCLLSSNAVATPGLASLAAPFSAGGSAWYPLSKRRRHRARHAEGRAADVLERIDRDRDLALPSPMALQSLSDSTGASADAMRRLTTASMVYKAVGHAPR